MRKIKGLMIFLAVFSILTGIIFAKTINRDEAIQVFAKWNLLERAHGRNTNSFQTLQDLKYQNQLIGYVIILEPSGYIIVPGITELSPIKFISYSGDFDEARSHPFLTTLFHRMHYTLTALGYIQNPEPSLLFHAEVKPDEIQIRKNEASWESLLKITESEISKMASIQDVAPLLSSSWGQGSPYNDLTPLLNNGMQSVTGCSATAMAQVMYYWKHPERGQGSHSYYWYHGAQTLSADFDHFYQWDEMLDQYTGGETSIQRYAVAHLMSDVGIAINMQYGLDKDNHPTSGAVANANNAFHEFFKYSQDVRYENRSHYNTWDEWFIVFRNQVVMGRPAILATFKEDPQNPGEYFGHAVVVDGYRIFNSQNQLDINMGWNGSSNGYYTLDDVCGYADADMDYAVVDIYPAPASEFSISAPNASTLWTKGGTGSIRWSTSGDPVSSIRIQLFKGTGTDPVAIISETTTNDGVFDWTPVPTGISDGSDYYIQIQDVFNTAIKKASANFSIGTGGSGTLCDAVDNCGFTWTTGGSAPWFRQTSVYHNGGDAAQSGHIGDGQSSWMQTTVQGPGTISYYWRISSEFDWDFLRFYIDGTEYDEESGNSSFYQRTHSIGTGSHTLRWEYTKDIGGGAAGSDCGWVDQFEFTPLTYALAVSCSPSAGGNVAKTPDKDEYTSGETVNLQALPAIGYVFSGWSGDATGSSNPISVTMNGNKSITANFAPRTYTLSISNSPAGGGSVLINPDKTTYGHGETVELTPQANTGYSFTGWSGDATGSGTPLLLSMTSNKSVTANYTAISYTISGYVRDDGGTGITGVVMNGLPGPPSTSAGGAYSASVPHGWSGTVTPSHAGYTFTPLSRNYSNVTSDLSNQNYSEVVVLTPEIAVSVAGVDVPDGGNVEFGAHPSGSSTGKTFVIENTGNADLILSGSPIIQITGANAADFQIESQPLSSVASGGSTSFKINFEPDTAGSKTAAVAISNNDSNENPFNISLSGSCSDGLGLPYTDSFEDGDLEGWSIINGQVTSSTDRSSTGLYAMKLYDGSTSYSPLTVLELQSSSSRVAVEFYEWTSDFGYDGGTVYQLKTDSDHLTGWGLMWGAQYYTDGKWQYIDQQNCPNWKPNPWTYLARDFPVPVTAQVNSWHKIRMEIYGPEGKAKFWYDNQYKGEIDITPTTQPIRYFVHGISWSTPTGAVNYIDDFRMYELHGSDNYGVYRPDRCRFYMDWDWDGFADRVVPYGGLGDIPVTGDWDGDGDMDYGVYRPSRGKFFLDTNGDSRADIVKSYGGPGDIPVTGDWNGDGRTNYGIYRPSRCKFYLDTNWNTLADIVRTYGGKGDKPITGDWNGDGITDIGVFRPSRCRFYLDTNGDGIADIVKAYGGLGDLPVSGDWDGDGITNYGVFRPSKCRFYLDFNWDTRADLVRVFGGVGDVPVSGDWDGR